MKPGLRVASGLVLGLILGLLYTWVLAPAGDYPTYPPLMGPEYRQDWTRMTALAYAMEGNMERTQLRLRDLPEDEVRQVLARTLESAVSASMPIERLERLAQLASAYRVSSPAVAVYAGSPQITPTERPPAPEAATPAVTAIAPTPSPTATAAPLPLPTPTATPQPTLTAPYQIVTQTFACEDMPRIAVSLVVSRTVTQRGRESVEFVGLPGHELWLIWDEGADRAITGLKPEIGIGYADFAVLPGHTYNLYVDAAIGVPVTTVRVEPCTEEEGGGWVSRTITLLRQAEE